MNPKINSIQIDLGNVDNSTIYPNITFFRGEICIPGARADFVSSGVHFHVTPASLVRCFRAGMKLNEQRALSTGIGIPKGYLERAALKNLSKSDPELGW
jgi:hypothetical protein